MDVRLDWLGVATYRLTVGDTVLFLDAYMDRVPAAPPVGMGTADVERADWVLVGHSHFDHLWGAERIAAQTGATVVGSHETVRIMREAGVHEQQVMAVAGGEPVRLSDDVRVRVFPSLHSCVWASGLALHPAEECVGDLGLDHQERQERMGRLLSGVPDGADRQALAAVAEHLKMSDQHPRGDGGSLAYLIETPEGSLLWKDTSGHWSGVLAGLRPDVALLAAAGRANVDGEPVQGSLAGFLAAEVALLRPERVVLGHHDDWLPPFTSAPDVDPIRARVAEVAPAAEVVDMGYLEGRRILG